MKRDKFPENVLLTCEEDGDDDFLSFNDTIEDAVGTDENVMVATYKLVKVEIISHNKTYRRRKTKNEFENEEL